MISEKPQFVEQQYNMLGLPSFPAVGDDFLADASPVVLEEIVPTISEIRLSLKQARIEDRDEGSTNDPIVAVDPVVDADPIVVEDEEEVRSTPKMPHNGMAFASLEEAKEHYNSYAEKIDFFIRIRILVCT